MRWSVSQPFKERYYWGGGGVKLLDNYQIEITSYADSLLIRFYTIYRGFFLSSKFISILIPANSSFSAFVWFTFKNTLCLVTFGKQFRRISSVVHIKGYLSAMVEYTPNQWF